MAGFAEGNTAEMPGPLFLPEGHIGGTGGSTLALAEYLGKVMDQSPSLFIRNIRLQRAAQLITEGKLSITEIAEHTGFSSSSYLSKCFQEMYGCRPSEYAEKAKEST